jgi:cardiolipin synthase
VACTLVELAERGGLVRGRRRSGILGALRHGLAAARAVPARRLAYLGWVLFSAALGAWVFARLRPFVAPATWATEIAVQAAWLVLAAAIGYVHLELVRRADGTPRRSFLVPNGLTFCRLALAPLVGFTAAHALALRSDADAILWPVVFVVGSDILDGQIARLFDLRSEWGRLADPFSDIFLAAFFAGGLWAGGLLPAWLAFLIVFRFAGTLLAVFAIWGRGQAIRVDPTWPGRAANVAVEVYMPFLLGGAIRWPSWVGAEWLQWMYRVAAAAVVVNIVYFSWRLARAVTARPR